MNWKTILSYGLLAVLAAGGAVVGGIMQDKSCKNYCKSYCEEHFADFKKEEKDND